MAPIPTKHSRQESYTGSSSRPVKVLRSGGDGLVKDRAIVLDDSDDDNDSGHPFSSDGRGILVDQKFVKNAGLSEVCIL